METTMNRCVLNWIVATSQVFLLRHFPVKDLESHGLKSNVKLKRCAFRIICSDSNRMKVNDWLSNCVFRELRRHIQCIPLCPVVSWYKFYLVAFSFLVVLHSRFVERPKSTRASKRPRQFRRDSALHQSTRILKGRVVWICKGLVFWSIAYQWTNRIF